MNKYTISGISMQSSQTEGSTPLTVTGTIPTGHRRVELASALNPDGDRLAVLLARHPLTRAESEALTTAMIVLGTCPGRVQACSLVAGNGAVYAVLSVVRPLAPEEITLVIDLANKLSTDGRVFPNNSSGARRGE